MLAKAIDQEKVMDRENWSCRLSLCHHPPFVRVFYLVVTKTSKLFEPGPLNVTQHKGEPREKERASRDKRSDI